MGDEVEYIGWKSYGMLVQLVPVGANLTWPKPLAALAVIEPTAPVVVSCDDGLQAVRGVVQGHRVVVTGVEERQPCSGSGFPEPTGSKLTGFGGPCGVPFLVR